MVKLDVLKEEEKTFDYNSLQCRVTILVLPDPDSARMGEYRRGVRLHKCLESNHTLQNYFSYIVIAVYT